VSGPYGIDPDNIEQTGGEGYEGGGLDGLVDRAEGAAQGTVDRAGDRFEGALRRTVEKSREDIKGAAREAVADAAPWVVGGVVLVGLVAWLASSGVDEQRARRW